MTQFIQIHTLTGFSSALINRDDTGHAKRINFGGTMRTRISSQCQKRAWRMNEGQDAIRDLAGAADDVRTKLLIENLAENLKTEGADSEAVDQIMPFFVTAVYGAKAWNAKKPGDMSSRQGLLFGAAEVRFFEDQMLKVLSATDETHPPAGEKDKKTAVERAAEEFSKEKNYKAIMKQMRSDCAIPGGLISSLFGRMVTSDPEANVDAAIHVAHAFTVHPDRSETDFFSAVDDLTADGGTGAGHIGDTEIGSGLFYGYVVVDVDLLVSNLGGDRELAGEVVDRLVRLISSVSPGAKRGSTAPYSYASTVMVETGEAQPRSLSDAFRKPVQPETHEAAETALAAQMASMDAIYQTGEDRAWLSVRNDADLPGQKNSLNGVAAFASDFVKKG